jgi:hypothetical protein
LGTNKASSWLGWSGILTLSTLGLDSLRDGIYADTANAIGKPSGITAAVQTLSGLIMLTGALVISSIRLSFRPTSNLHPITNSLVLLLVATVFLVVGVRTSYVTQLAAYTVKLEIISAPYLSDVQIKQFRARVVQVTNRADYLANVEALRKVIEASGQKAPSRDFF